MKARYFFFLLLLPLCAKAQTGWRYIGPDTLDVATIYGQGDSLLVITVDETKDGLLEGTRGWITTNSGNTWSQISYTRIDMLPSRFITPDLSHFERLYKIQDDKAFRSIDFGRNWDSVVCRCGGSVSWKESRIYPAPYDTNTIFIRTWMGFSFPVHIMNRSTDGGNTWEDISIGGTSSHGRELHLAPWEGGPVLYLYFQDRMSRENLYVSTNGGREWQIIGTPLINLMFIQTSHWDDQELYSYSPALHQSQDGGYSFRSLNPIQLNFGEDSVTQDVGFFISRIERERLYIASQDSGVYRSTDRGDTWIKIEEMKYLPRSPQGYNQNRPVSIRASLYIDERASRIYAGTGKGVYTITNSLTNVINNFRDDDIPIELTCYPNPVHDDFNIRYELLFESMVRIELIDMFGRNVRIIMNEFQDRGKYSIALSTETLLAGMYLLRVSLAKKVLLRKILVID